MKVAIILRELLISGGGERQGLMLARELMRRGDSVRVYTTALDRKNCFPEDTAKLDIFVLPKEELERIKSKKSILPRGFALHMRESDIARSLAEHIDADTDVVNPNDNWGARVGYFFKQRAGAAVSILMLNDVVTARWTLFDDPLFGRTRALWKRPIEWFKDMLEQPFFSSQDTIVVLSDRTGDLVERFYGMKAVTVRSGVDHERFKFVPRSLPKKGETVRLLSHGILYVHRRYEDTIRALKLLEKQGIHATLSIIGDYAHRSVSKAYYDELQKMVQELGLGDRVFFKGRVSDDELVQSFYDADVFVSAAHMQTWGIAPFEALATGLPIAVSTTIGASEVLEDGLTAIKFEPGNPESQAGALLKLLSGEGVYEKLSREGNAFVRARMSWVRYADDMLALFERARAGRGKSG